MKRPLTLVPSLYDRVDVYLDESGDLGFSARSTRYFVVAALALPEPDGMTRVVKRIRRRHFLRFERSMELKLNGSVQSQVMKAGEGRCPPLHLAFDYM